MQRREPHIKKTFQKLGYHTDIKTNVRLSTLGYIQHLDKMNRVQ